MGDLIPHRPPYSEGFRLTNEKFALPTIKPTTAFLPTLQSAKPLLPPLPLASLDLNVPPFPCT